MRIDPEKLELTMARVGMTTARLAEESCADRHTIQDIRSGKRGRNHPITVHSIAKALRVDPAELLDTKKTAQAGG